MLPYSILSESLKYEATPNSAEHAQSLNAVQVNKKFLIVTRCIYHFYDVNVSHLSITIIREFTEPDLAQVHSK